MAVRKGPKAVARDPGHRGQWWLSMGDSVGKWLRMGFKGGR